MKAATFQATFEKLGIISSYSRPRVSNDNPYSEVLFKTLKYTPRFPQNGFSSIEEAREWVRKVVHWYNYTHLHSGLKFIIPYKRHYGIDEQIMKKRIETYKKARSLHPERWSKNIRDWKLPSYVSLTPVKEEEYKKLIQLGVLESSYI